MSRSLSLILVFFMFSLFPFATATAASQEPEKQAAETAPVQNDPYEQALKHFLQKDYDQVIILLEGASTVNPYDFPINTLLAEAIMEKAVLAKHAGDRNYSYLAKRAYVIGQRLYKSAPTRPEPYYIVGKSLIINDRPRKGGGVIKKALYYASPDDEAYADYQAALGDAWLAMMGDDSRAYGGAKAAYMAAMAMRKDDPQFVAMIKKKLAALESKHIPENEY